MQTKKLSFLLAIFFTALIQNFVAQGSYYTGVDLELTGLALKNELAGHIVSTHDNYLSYSEVWDVLMSSDLNPDNSNDVLLIYGYNDTDSDIINDRTRDKDDNGGAVGEWNREHVYPKSLGNPNLGTSGPGSDPHHLRSSDVQMNGNRSNLKFANGSGNAGSAGGGWFPGEEWKGDCARMMMYMYLRYGNQCLPNNVGIGSTNSVDNNMVNLFLEWNAEDPVSEYELERNDVVEDAQGNRNPFIDNPALATIIWGGAPAEDPWGIFVGVDEVDDLQSEIIIFPNPCSDFLTFENPKNLPVEQIMIFNQVGEVVIEENYTAIIDIRKLPEGYYYLKYVLEGSNSTEIQVEPFVVLKN